MEVLGPKGPTRYGGLDLLDWANRELRLASEIADNPGGGLLFATQTIGQVESALRDAGEERWRRVVDILRRAEDAMVRRDFSRARELLAKAGSALKR